MHASARVRVMRERVEIEYQSSTITMDGEGTGRVFERRVPARSGAQCYRSACRTEMAAPFLNLTKQGATATESSTECGNGSVVTGLKERMVHLDARINTVDREAQQLAKGESVWGSRSVRRAIAHGRDGPEGWSAMAERHGGLCKPDIVFFGEQLPPRFNNKNGMSEKSFYFGMRF